MADTIPLEEAARKMGIPEKDLLTACWQGRVFPAPVACFYETRYFRVKKDFRVAN